MPQYARPCLEPVRKGNHSADAESGFAENRSCSACLPPQAADEMGKCMLYWCGGKGKLTWVIGKFGVTLWVAYVQKIGFLHTLTKLFSQNSFLFSQKTTFCQTPPSYETHNLLSAQIGVCLFINALKSLRNKMTLSHRFKILRAVWHKVANPRKISW